MPNIKVKNTTNQDKTLTLMMAGGARLFTFPRNEEVSIDADAALFDKLRKANSAYCSGGLSWDENELQNALQQLKAESFAKFESLGVPAVKASVTSGELSRGDKHELAIEWLAHKELKSEGKKSSSSRFNTVLAIIGAVAAIISLF